MEVKHFGLNIDYGRVSDKQMLIGLISRFDNRYQAAADEFYKEISWTQFFCLKGISLFLSSPTIRDIANFLGCSHQNAAQLLQKLSKAGYVTFRIDEFDRRKQRLYLTQKAETFLREHAEAGDRAMDEIFAGVTEKEIASVIRMIMKLENSLMNYENRK